MTKADLSQDEARGDVRRPLAPLTRHQRAVFARILADIGLEVASAAQV